MNHEINAASDAYILETPDYFRLSRRVFVDPDIYAREKKIIFDRSWIFIGHHSEIPNRGDFAVRTVAERSFIFVRGQDDQVRVFFNVCPHRGATVCREKTGNTRLFLCMYHAWSFNTSGKTVGRPDADRYSAHAFDDGFDLRLARSDDYRGFHFLNVDGAAPQSLTAYLGGATFHLDRVTDKSATGLELVGGLHPIGLNGNWKSATENFLDLYHPAVLHQTYFEYLKKREEGMAGEIPPPGQEFSLHQSLGNGHAVIENRARQAGQGRPVALAAGSWGEAGKAEVAEIFGRLVARVGHDYADVLAYNKFNLVIFPNLIVSDNFATTVRTYDPAGPDKTIVNSWLLAPQEESPAMRARGIKNQIEFMGAAGLAQVDDAEAVEHIQKGYHATPDGWNDISRGLSKNDAVQSDETSMRVLWREWNRRMRTAN